MLVSSRIAAGAVRAADGSIIGREEQRAQLRSALSALVTGAGNQSLLLVGPRGSGKTITLQQALIDVALSSSASSVAPGSSSLESSSSASLSPSDAAVALSTLGHGLPFALVSLSGTAIADDHAAVREISRQLAIDPEAATAAALAKADAAADVTQSPIAISTTAPDSTSPWTPDTAAAAVPSSDSESESDAGSEAEARPLRRKRGRSGESRVTAVRVAHACVRAHRQTFEQHLGYVIDTLRGGRTAHRAVILVIDEFDVFCARTKQTLLYNLLDLTQDPTVQMMIIGITARADVADLLEKRLRSRFSNRQVLFPPVSPDQYEEIAMASVAPPRRSHEADTWQLSVMRETLQLGSVRDALRRWHAIGVPVRDMLQSLEWATRQLPSHPEPAAAAATTTTTTTAPVPVPATEAAATLLLRAGADLFRNPLEDMLPDLSLLEIVLLGAMVLIERRSPDPYNFAMTFTEYERFTRTQGLAMRPFDRDVALKAFEHLLELGHVRYTSLVADAPASAKAALHMARQHQLVRLAFDPEALIMGVREETIRVPTDVAHWLTHGVHT